MKGENMYSKVRENFYYIGISLMLLRAMIENSNLLNLNSTVDFTLVCLSAVFLGLKIVTERYSVKEFIIIVILGSLCIYTSWVCSYFAITMSFLTLVGVKNVNLIKTLKTIGFIIGIYLTICFGLFLVEFLKDGNNLPYYSITANNMKRYYVNFKNPNLFATLSFWCMGIFLYLLRQKKGIIKYIICLIISGIVYYFTLSNTTLILSILLLISFWCTEKNLKIVNQKLLYFFAKYIFIFLTIFTLIAMIGYNTCPSFFDIVDNILSRRVTLSVIAFRMYGLTVFPRAIDFPLVFWEDKYTMYLVIDNAYARAIINFGIVYLFIMYYIIRKSLKCKLDKYELILIIIMAISAFCECYIYSCYFCFPMIILVSKIFENIKNVRKDKSFKNKIMLIGDGNER